MAIEQNKVTAVQRARSSVHAAQDGPHDDQDQARRGQDRGRGPQQRRHLEGRADHDVVGPDQGRRHDARGRRHRRPLDPGRQARLLRAARLRLHASTDAGSLDLFYGTDPALPDISKVSIAIPANATATDVATLINANEGAPVYAAVVKDGATERLVFSARKTGVRLRLHRRLVGLQHRRRRAHRGHRLLARARRARSTPSYKLDGDPVAQDSESNVIESAIPGVRLTLKGVSASPVSVNTTQPAIDADGDHQEDHGARRRLQRRRHDDARRADREERSRPPTTSADLQKGQLFGDSGMNSMLSGLKNSMTQTLERPRPHQPGRPRHRRPQVHRRRRQRGRQGRQARRRHRPS